MFQSTFLIAAAYLAGSIPTGVLLAKILRPGLDLRQVGSGNIGATNVSRALGVKWGVVTMLGDCIKGLLPVLLAQKLSAGPLVIALTAFAAFLGHIYPIYLNMKGGKGVATALGVLLGISLQAAIPACVIWIGASVIARSTAVGALSAAVSLPIIAAGVFDKNAGIFFTLCLAISIMVFYTHRANIRGIIQGRKL